jgi:hypothetical protein
MNTMPIVLCLASLALAACSSSPEIIKPVAAQDQMVKPEELKCRSHSDCVRIEAIDGCGCSAGGFDGVANKKYAKIIRERIRTAHAAFRCLAVINADPACIGVIPYCYEGQCRLVHKR